jgi:hypothetical protein
MHCLAWLGDIQHSRMGLRNPFCIENETVETIVFVSTKTSKTNLFLRDKASSPE